jgi:hypothetical protein
MKVRVLFAIAAVVLFVTLASADDPWKDGNYQSWTDKDVKKVLESSPWGHEIVTATKDMPKENAGKVSNTSVKRYDEANPEQLPSEFVQVWWWSSKTARRAVLRKAMLVGLKVGAEQAKEFTETPLDDHVIVVCGDPKTLVAMARMEPAELKKVAYLESPRLKLKIEPIDAAAIVEGNAPPDKIRFHFPRKLNGQDTVTSEDTRVIFKWRLVRNPSAKIEDAKQFEVVFTPSKMISGGAADF